MIVGYRNRIMEHTEFFLPSSENIPKKPENFQESFC